MQHLKNKKQWINKFNHSNFQSHFVANWHHILLHVRPLQQVVDYRQQQLTALLPWESFEGAATAMAPASSSSASKSSSSRRVLLRHFSFSAHSVINSWLGMGRDGFLPRRDETRKAVSSRFSARRDSNHNGCKSRPNRDNFRLQECNSRQIRAII